MQYRHAILPRLIHKYHPVTDPIVILVHKIHSLNNKISDIPKNSNSYKLHSSILLRAPVWATWHLHSYRIKNSCRLFWITSVNQQNVFGKMNGRIKMSKIWHCLTLGPEMCMLRPSTIMDKNIWRQISEHYTLTKISFDFSSQWMVNVEWFTEPGDMNMNITLQHSRHVPTNQYHHDCCKCPFAIYAPSHPKSPCWPDYNYSTIMSCYEISHVTSIKQTKFNNPPRPGSCCYWWFHPVHTDIICDLNNMFQTIKFNDFRK